MRPHSLILAALASAAASSVEARCPDLSRYSVSSISLRNGSLDVAIRQILRQTAWDAEFVGPATDIRLSLVGVSGPMDTVLENVIRRAGESGAVESISSIIDHDTCTVRIDVVPNRPEPPPITEGGESLIAEAATQKTNHDPDPSERHHVLLGGMRLSEALSKYVESHGWSLRWRIDDDFIIDTDIPVPPSNVIDGVTNVIRAYQSAGAMISVRPRFANPNRVVVIESTGDQP
ncbi:MAG: hypothetical protein DDT25_00081 [Chloroflexi bacterium]|nr:hypothetical protein [Chloroflexota bacterium]